jgi:hypothetical protein
MFLKLENFIIYVSLCNSRIHVTTLYSGHVCVYYASMLQCWHLVWILVRTDHPCLGVGCHIEKVKLASLSDSLTIKFEALDSINFLIHSNLSGCRRLIVQKSFQQQGTLIVSEVPTGAKNLAQDLIPSALQLLNLTLLLSSNSWRPGS